VHAGYSPKYLEEASLLKNSFIASSDSIWALKVPFFGRFEPADRSGGDSFNRLRRSQNFSGSQLNAVALLK
jgi:hypothetical protein